MRKFLLIILGLMLFFCVVGGKDAAVFSIGASDLRSKYMDLVAIPSSDIGATIRYDKNTKVMYYECQNGITPIYNSDGTVKLYDGE